MSGPVNTQLYENIRDLQEISTASGSRSGLIVKEYKYRGGKYSGQENQSSGLNRWFRENWTNQRNESRS